MFYILALVASVVATTPGNLKSIESKDNATFEITAENANFLVNFYANNTVRLSMLVGSQNWTSLNTSMLVGKRDITVTAKKSDQGTYVDLTTAFNTVRVFKTPLTFSFGVDQNAMVEADQISWDSSSVTQTLKYTSSQQAFFGTGMQSGFNYRGSKVTISASETSKAPFHMTSSQHGIFYNTWGQGTYDFTGDASYTLQHKYSKTVQLDAFVFTGSYKEMLNRYTYVTGRPFMIPIYGLGLGDSNCYHNANHDWSSRSALNIAKTYNDKSIPAAWLLYDDGYGCGIGEEPNVKDPLDLADNKYIADELKSMGFVAGLWSSTGLHNFSTEVKDGVRVAKTDVAWIGSGYEYAFKAVQEVADGIESNSDSRRFIYTVMGWSGTHKNAVMWSGDLSGSWKYEVDQIPFYINAGMTGMAHISGDLDGIFGGSPATYVRDMQFKSMMTAFMTMSGWASNPQRQPWANGEPYESISRLYLDLKMQLTPYQYTICREAYETGYPPVRAMLLEFPNDSFLTENTTYTRTQFMSGPSLLVAPIQNASNVRDVYLPAGKWYDFWTDASYTTGVLKGFEAPLTTLPLFVKEGAIIPKWRQGILHAKNVNLSDDFPLIVDVWLPRTSAIQSSEFVVYEDDGVTRQHEDGKYTKTKITVLKNNSSYSVSIKRVEGNGFDDMPTTRPYHFKFHIMTDTPSSVKASGSTLKQYHSPVSLGYNGVGWAFEKYTKTIEIFTGRLSTSAEQTIGITF